MDIEALAIGAVAAGSLAGALGLHLGRTTAKAPEVEPVRLHYSPPLTVATGPEGHVHSATTNQGGTWKCECGLECHVYAFDIAGNDELKRCECGAEGIGKEWATDGN